MASHLSSAFSGCSNLEGILKGLEEADAPSHKPQALKRRKLVKPKAKAAPEANAKPAPGGKVKAKAAAEAKAKAMAAPAMAAPVVEPVAEAAPGDCAAPEKEALSMSRKCVTSRAYCSAKAKAKADGKCAAECKEAAQKAYKDAAFKWDQEYA